MFLELDTSIPHTCDKQGLGLRKTTLKDLDMCGGRPFRNKRGDLFKFHHVLDPGVLGFNAWIPVSHVILFGCM